MKIDTSRTYNTNSQSKFKTAMLKLGLCDYIDVHILVKGTIKVTGALDNAAEERADKRNKYLIFKKFLPFTYCINKIKNTQIDNAKHLDDAMTMYDLIE